MCPDSASSGRSVHKREGDVQGLPKRNAVCSAWQHTYRYCRANDASLPQGLLQPQTKSLFTAVHDKALLEHMSLTVLALLTEIVLEVEELAIWCHQQQQVERNSTHHSVERPEGIVTAPSARQDHSAQAFLRAMWQLRLYICRIENAYTMPPDSRSLSFDEIINVHDEAYEFFRSHTDEERSLLLVLLASLRGCDVKTPMLTALFDLDDYIPYGIFDVGRKDGYAMLAESSIVLRNHMRRDYGC